MQRNCPHVVQTYKALEKRVVAMKRQKYQSAAPVSSSLNAITNRLIPSEVSAPCSVLLLPIPNSVWGERPVDRSIGRLDGPVRLTPLRRSPPRSPSLFYTARAKRSACPCALVTPTRKRTATGPRTRASSTTAARKSLARRSGRLKSRSVGRRSRRALSTPPPPFRAATPPRTPTSPGGPYAGLLRGAPVRRD